MNVSHRFVIVTAIFVTSLITANIIVVKPTSFGGIPAAIIIFPLSYVIGDILTEVYGYRLARRVIWLGLFCNLIAVIAIWIGQDDGKSPVIRLDSIGKHEIGSGSSQQAIIDKLVIQPLDRIGLKLTQIDKYATEMHNPEITEPQGNGNVSRTNYRTIGSFAVLRNEIKREDLDRFVEIHGMPGFSPTQGHIASAVPVLGHSIRKIMANEMENTLFLAKGSLFLGRVTQLSDGISFLLERNKGG